MGHIAEKYSDYVVITSDNPRGEDPKNIINDILEGVEEDVEIFEDRAKAIQYAIQTASDRDIILIAGKGHEGYQLINDSRITFVDNDHADRALKNRLNISND
jgi:UDP-N-acetylmuramoyl-L-alanyl-D-glutamate--2,6-diaminopimelate ligase